MERVGWFSMITTLEDHWKKGVLGRDRKSASVAGRKPTLGENHERDL